MAYGIYGVYQVYRNLSMVTMSPICQFACQFLNGLIHVMCMPSKLIKSPSLTYLLSSALCHQRFIYLAMSMQLKWCFRLLSIHQLENYIIHFNPTLVAFARRPANLLEKAMGQNDDRPPVQQQRKPRGTAQATTLVGQASCWGGAPEMRRRLRSSHGRATPVTIPVNCRWYQWWYLMYLPW